MTTIAQDRIVRKEVSLGQVREIAPPTSHIGLSIAPMLDVQSDDVIFQYVAPDVSGLAPARAEDAESELAEKDDTIGAGRASTIDWSIKDHYDASDVTRYREFLRVAEQMGSSLPITVGSMTEDFAAKIARDTRTRRKKLDNRIEWLIMESLKPGSTVSYNDGKVQFSVPFGRPSGQDVTASTLWSSSSSDPINEVLDLEQDMYDTYSIRFGTAIASGKAIRSLLNSDKWAARSGMAVAGGPATGKIDPRYTIDGWGVAAAKAVFQAQTGIQLVEYDSVYRTRAMGSTTTVNNRFLPEDTIVFLPRQEFIDELDDTEIGFAKTLTSPHPEGGFTPSFYEWEKERRDPWGTDRGTGIKAFPVFPHMDLTATMKVL